MFFRSTLLLFFVFAVFSTTTFAQNFEDGFNFVLPHDDASAQLFLPNFPKNPITDFIQADSDGHFSSNGKTIRFWGANLTTQACFPLKADAPSVTGRLNKMGINLLRFHHMDNPWTSDDGSIFLRQQDNTRTLDPTTLDRLHFFLAEMKKQAIYANINLHVSRTFKEGDGVLHADSIRDFGKAVTMFDPQLISLQKEFAQQLLTTVNPYTGLSLIDDPVMAMLEITNENSIYGFWKSNKLRPFRRGGGILQRHSDLLDEGWNQFLKDKYQTQAQLETAWSDGSQMPGDDQVNNRDFENGDPNLYWELEEHQGANGVISIDSVNSFAGNYSAKVTTITSSTTDWHLQFKFPTLAVEAGKSYFVKMHARADRNRSVFATVMRDNNPYTWYGGSGIDLTTDWQEYTFTITAPENNPGQTRLTINIAGDEGDIWFDEITFQEKGVKSFDPGEQLSTNTIKRISWQNKPLYANQRIADQAEFYLQLQTHYYDEMYDYLKNTLAVKVPITGTNALTGQGDAMSMKGLDYIDDHAYWGHPYFPGGEWSTTDWSIDNQPMIKDRNLGTMARIFGGLAVEKKPYTISEYNHPFPNRFQTEMFPILTAYASLHDADGLMIFEYNGRNDNWQEDVVDNFFSIHRNHALMGMSPLYAYAYRNHLLQADPNPISIDYHPDYIYQLANTDTYGRWTQYFPYNSDVGLLKAIRTRSYDATEDPDFSDFPRSPRAIFSTASFESTINTETGVLITAAPRFLSVSGFLNELSNYQMEALEFVSCTDFGTFSWLSLTDDKLTEAQRSIIAISSKIQNTGMVWEGTETVGSQFGSSPTEIHPLSIELKLNMNASSLRIYPLDGRGAQSTYTTYLPDANGQFKLTLDQKEDKTLWYGVEAMKSTQTQVVDPTYFSLHLNPNPADQYLQTQFTLPNPSEEVVLSITDPQGKVLGRHRIETKGGVNYQERLETAKLAGGWYLLNLEAGDKRAAIKFVVQR